MTHGLRSTMSDKVSLLKPFTFPLVNLLLPCFSRALCFSVLFYKARGIIIMQRVPYSITSVGLGADPGFLAVNPQMTSS